MKNKSILVTGGTGSFGQQFVESSLNFFLIKLYVSTEKA